MIDRRHRTGARGLSRRRLLGASAALGAAAFSAGPGPALAAALAPTPRQPEGPFYTRFKPLSIDNDLLYAPGRSARAKGQLIHVGGRVLDPSGKPVRGARVEIWQANAFGRYNHPRDQDSTLEPDPNFQGSGHDRTDDDGAYRFRTIKPAAYRTSASWVRPPHIHFAVFAPGTDGWTTQMYFEGEELNAKDRLLQSIRDAQARSRLVVALMPPGPELEADSLVGTFDIVLATPGGKPKGA